MTEIDAQLSSLSRTRSPRPRWRSSRRAAARPDAAAARGVRHRRHLRADADRDPGDADRRGGRHAGGLDRRARPAARRDRHQRPARIRACSRRSRPASCAPVALPEVDRARRSTIGAAPGAQALVQGFVRANGDGTLTVGCYLYDVFAQTELARQGFVVPPVRLAPRRAQMRRHGLCAADRRGPVFRQPRRLCLRDRPQGEAHQAAGDHGPGRRQPPLPDQRPVDRADAALRAEPAVDRLHELCRTIARRSTSTISARGGSGWWCRTSRLTFAPRFSPDGRWILFSMAAGGNTDIYRVAARRRHAAAADELARDRHRRQLFARRHRRSCSRAIARAGSSST